VSDPTAPKPDDQGTRPDGFYRGQRTIAAKVARANQETAQKLNERCSEETSESITALAWRPAWSIRSRRGSLKALTDWWREIRA